MRKIITILFILTGVLLFSNAYAQENKKEDQKDAYRSLKLRSSSRDAQRLLNEADELKNKNPKEALNKIQEALAMSLAEQDDFTEGRSYVLIGEINEAIQEWKLALENYTHAYQKLMDYPASPEFKKTLYGLGVTNLKLTNYEQSLKFYQEALALPLNSSEKAECQLNLSEVYYEMKNYDEALKVLEDIRNSSKKGGYNSSFESRLQNQKAKVYARMNELDKTRALYDNSLNSLRSGKNSDAQSQQSVQETKEEIADVLQDQKLYDDEIDLRKQSIAYNLESNNLAEVTKDKVAISKTLDAKGETAAALKEAEEAALLADSLDNPKEQANAFLSLANLYEKSGKNTRAISAYKKYSEAVIKNEAQSQTQLLEKSELIKQQKDIEEITKDVSIGQREETIEKATVFRQQLIIYGLLFLMLITAITSYFIYKSAQASKVANQLLALKSLRSQMNPHFIFNALNSVNHFIAQQDERTANKFLSEFSLLMRLVLENSQEDFIPLSKEQEILSLYLKLEHYRFRDKFDYEINIDESISAESIEVPPMLIQPYIENAVWHGLRYKETKGKLSLNIFQENKFLVVEVEDDGIGRKRSAELKTENQRKHNSTGLKNIQDRLQIINKVYKANYKVAIEDFAENTGTRVRIYLPLTNRTIAA